LPADNPEQQIRELEETINGAYAANDLPTYFSYYASDFSQWLPEGRTDLPTYQKDWTNFIQSGGRVEAATANPSTCECASMKPGSNDLPLRSTVVVARPTQGSIS
jgi:hypothetical protein